MSQPNLQANLKAKQASRLEKKKNTANKLVIVEGYEGEGENAVMIGKEPGSKKVIRVILRDLDPAKPPKRPRPSIDEILNYDDAKKKVEIGGIIMAEDCISNDADDSVFTARWLSTYQHKSMKDTMSWLQTEPSERLGTSGVTMAISGLCNVTMYESSSYRNSEGEDVNRAEQFLVDLYSTPKAKIFNVSSMVEMESFVTEALTSTNAVLNVDTTALIRCIHADTNESSILGIPTSRNVLEDGEWVREAPAITAKKYLDATLKDNDSPMSAIAEFFNEGGMADIEYVPGTRLKVVGDSLAKMNVFDDKGKILKSAEGATSKTAGEIYKSVYRTSAHAGSQVRLVQTHISAFCSIKSNSLIISKFKQAKGYAKSHTLETVPTENFTPNVESKKDYTPKSTEQRQTQVEEKKPEDKPLIKNEQVAAVDVKQTTPDPDEMSKADLAELEASLDELDMSGFDLPGLS
jgi:hypothetical protein